MKNVLRRQPPISYPVDVVLVASSAGEWSANEPSQATYWIGADA